VCVAWATRDEHCDLQGNDHEVRVTDTWSRSSSFDSAARSGRSLRAPACQRTQRWSWRPIAADGPVHSYDCSQGTIGCGTRRRARGQSRGCCAGALGTVQLRAGLSHLDAVGAAMLSRGRRGGRALCSLLLGRQHRTATGRDRRATVVRRGSRPRRAPRYADARCCGPRCSRWTAQISPKSSYGRTRPTHR
jgi:hypothetical protein